MSLVHRHPNTTVLFRIHTRIHTVTHLAALQVAYSPQFQPTQLPSDLTLPPRRPSPHKHAHTKHLTTVPLGSHVHGSKNRGTRQPGSRQNLSCPSLCKKCIRASLDPIHHRCLVSNQARGGHRHLDRRAPADLGYRRPGEVSIHIQIVLQRYVFPIFFFPVFDLRANQEAFF